MAVWQRKIVMEKKIVQDPVSGRFIWKEVDENGSSTGVRSEGDFATEQEAMEDAGLVPATPEASEESVEETDDSTLEESSEEIVDETVSEDAPTDEAVSNEIAEEESAE